MKQLTAWDKAHEEYLRSGNYERVIALSAQAIEQARQEERDKYADLVAAVYYWQATGSNTSLRDAINRFTAATARSSKPAEGVHPWSGVAQDTVKCEACGGTGKANK